MGLVSRSINTMTFADGACEARSRSKEKAMQGHRRRRATQRSSATSISPKGGGGRASISLSLLLHDAHRHRVVVASRTRRRRARHKRHHIYGTRHLPTGLVVVFARSGSIYWILIQKIESKFRSKFPGPARRLPLSVVNAMVIGTQPYNNRGVGTEFA